MSHPFTLYKVLACTPTIGAHQAYELTCWEVDVLGADSVGVDFVRVDLVGLSLPLECYPYVCIVG